MRWREREREEGVYPKCQQGTSEPKQGEKVVLLPLRNDPIPSVVMRESLNRWVGTSQQVKHGHGHAG